MKIQLRYRFLLEYAQSSCIQWESSNMLEFRGLARAGLSQLTLFQWACIRNVGSHDI